MTAPDALAFTHVIATRFNLRSGGAGGYSEDWMTHRMALFRRHTVPAIQRQTRNGFRWVVYFDAERTAPWRDEIAGLCSACPALEPVYLEAGQKFQADLSARGPEAGAYLTSRVDNDDLLHPSFVAEVQDRAALLLAEGIGAPAVIDYPLLSFWGPEAEELRRFPSGIVTPFATLLEPAAAGGWQTVYCEQHPKLGQRFARVERLSGARTMAVVHERNLLNGVRKTDWVSRFKAFFRFAQWPLRRSRARAALADFGVPEGTEPAIRRT